MNIRPRYRVTFRGGNLYIGTYMTSKAYGTTKVVWESYEGIIFWRNLYRQLDLARTNIETVEPPY